MERYVVPYHKSKQEVWNRISTSCSKPLNNGRFNLDWWQFDKNWGIHYIKTQTTMGSLHHSKLPSVALQLSDAPGLSMYGIAKVNVTYCFPIPSGNDSSFVKGMCIVAFLFLMLCHKTRFIQSRKRPFRHF